jgi:hypothetical protein
VGIPTEATKRTPAVSPYTLKKVERVLEIAKEENRSILEVGKERFGVLIFFSNL